MEHRIHQLVGFFNKLFPVSNNVVVTCKVTPHVFFSSHLFPARSRFWTVVLGSLLANERNEPRNDCCTGQSPGNEITVLLNPQAKGGVAKSKPCSSRRGWGSARGGAGSRGMWAKSLLRGGFSNIFCTYNVLRFTSCALNGPSLGIQDQSQKFL